MIKLIQGNFWSLRLGAQIFYWLLLLKFISACSSVHESKSLPSTASYSGHGAESVSPQLLNQFAPPALSSTQSSRIESMLDIRGPSLGVIAPGGQVLFVNWDVTGTQQVWKIPGAGRFPIQMTGGQDKTSAIAVTPDGKYLILSRDKQGEEYPGLYFQSVNGGSLTPIIHEKKVQAFYEFITPDGQYLYFRANNETPQSYTIYRYHFPSARIEKILALEGYWTISDFRGKGEKLLLTKWTGNTSSEIYEYHQKTQKLIPLFGQNENQEYLASWGAKENEIIVLTNKFRDFRSLYRWQNHQFSPITPEWDFDIDQFYLDRPKEKILYVINKKGLNRVGAINARSFKEMSLPDFRKELGKEYIHSYYGMTSRDGQFTAIGIETTKAPRVNYIYDWKKKKLERWVFPSTPEIDTSQFVEETLETYPARDGTLIPMFVSRPSHCKKQLCPVIVNFHGGPEGQSKPGFAPILQLFIEKGFIFVSPNVRGSDGYGKKWLDADNGPKRLEVITDIEDCALFIKKNWLIEGKVPKVGIMGGSYGGYAALLGLSKFAGSYDAGVAIVGMSNLLTFLQNTAPYRRILRISEYGDPERDQEALLKLSPITYLSRIESPLLIIHGINDPRVPAGEAIQIYDELKRRDRTVRLILFSNEGHGVTKRENKVLTFGHVLSFFDEYLR